MLAGLSPPLAPGALDHPVHDRLRRRLRPPVPARRSARRSACCPSERGFGARRPRRSRSALITLGLLSSSPHLGHPERAWRAVSQWRSSWLSREGALALAHLRRRRSVSRSAGSCLERTGGWFALCRRCSRRSAPAATVWCTGMIYASLKPIRQWHQPLVAPLYLAFALMSGALLLHLLLAAFGAAARRRRRARAARDGPRLRRSRRVYWRGDRRAAAPRSTPESATGLGALGPGAHDRAAAHPDQLPARRDGLRVARKHARKLRLLAYASGSAAALLLTLAGADRRRLGRRRCSRRSPRSAGSPASRSSAGCSSPRRPTR